MECLLIAAQLAPLCDNGIVFTEASSQRLFKFVILVSPLPLKTSSTTCYQITRTYLFSVWGSNNDTFLTPHTKVIITTFDYYMEIFEMLNFSAGKTHLANTLHCEKYTRAIQNKAESIYLSYDIRKYPRVCSKRLLSYRWNPG